MRQSVCHIEKLEGRVFLSVAVTHTGVVHRHPSRSISGFVFNDTNGDGLQQAGEPGIAGATVYIDKNHDRKPDAADPVAITDASGHYLITGLHSTSSTVRESMPAGWKLEPLVKQGKHHRHRIAHGGAQNFANAWTGGTNPAIARQAGTAPVIGVASHYTVTSLTAGLSIPQGSTPISINRFGQVLFSLLATGPVYLYSNGAVTPLGTWQSAAQNDSGDVALLNFRDFSIWLYSHGIFKQIAPPVPGANSIFGFNASGQVLVVGATSAWIVSASGVVTVTPPSGFAQIIEVTGFNDAGQVVGLADNGLGPGTPFLYSNGSSIVLNPPGGSYSYARGIDDQGQVLVQSTLEDGLDHLYLYTDGSYTEIKPPGAVGGAWGLDLGESGDFVGAYNDANHVEHQFLYHDGTFSETGLLYGIAMNASDEVIGYAYTYQGFMPHGFAFSGGVLHDLNDLIGPDPGWVIAQANAIDDQGDIIGLACPIVNGQPNYGEADTILLTPT